MEEDNADNAPIDAWQLLRRSTAKTAVQGVSNISEARSHARKTFWAFVVVAGVGRLRMYSYFQYNGMLMHNALSGRFG